MKTNLFFILSVLLSIIPAVNVSSTTGKYSANGGSFTPKGDLRALIICVGFGPEYDNQSLNGWDSAPEAIPDIMKNDSLFYSDFSKFTLNPPARAMGNVSAYYYVMSGGKFRFVADVYPKRINIPANGTENWTKAAKKVIAQMKIQDPDFDWSRYDKRQNFPNYLSDNSISSPDKKPDYVIIVYRYSKSFGNAPFKNFEGGAYAAIDLDGTDTYNGYTFNGKCGYTQVTADGYFMTLFIHEVAHSLFDAPHVSGSNTVMGYYYFLEKGWSQMGQEYTPFVCSNAWERWYLDWIDGIKADKVNADIRSAADLTASGQYVLRDFITTGDAVRIKIPNGDGRNQYLWLENHQGKTIYDNKLYNSDQCNTFPSSPRGIVAYIESINDDKYNPGNTFTPGANGIKFIHAAGNFDYTYDTPPTIGCWYDNDVYNFHRKAENPISGQCGAQEIRSDFNNNNQIDLNYGANGVTTLVKQDNKTLLKRDDVFKYDFMTGERAFAAGRKFSSASNPCLINRPTYNPTSDKMSPYYLNGISVSVLSYDKTGNAKIKIRYKDIDITNDTRYAGTIYLPDITDDVNPDINIPANVTLRIDKSGTPNKRLKTAAGDFINPTEFRCLTNSYFKQSAYSKVYVENGSSLIIENGAKYEINSYAELGIQSGSHLIVKAGGTLILRKSGRLSVEPGAEFTVEPGGIYY